MISHSTSLGIPVFNVKLSVAIDCMSVTYVHANKALHLTACCMRQVNAGALCCGAQLPTFGSVILDTVLLDKPTSTLMATKSLDQRIIQTSDVCRGKPRIAGHRITVQNIAIWHDRLGWSADEIASEYDLELADVYAALAYYFAHREEIDQSIRESEAFVEELRRQMPSKLQQKLEGEG